MPINFSHGNDNAIIGSNIDVDAASIHKNLGRLHLKPKELGLVKKRVSVLSMRKTSHANRQESKARRSSYVAELAMLESSRRLSEVSLAHHLHIDLAGNNGMDLDEKQLANLGTFWI